MNIDWQKSQEKPVDDTSPKQVKKLEKTVAVILNMPLPPNKFINLKFKDIHEII